jgi:hypothetical protein
VPNKFFSCILNNRLLISQNLICTTHKVTSIWIMLPLLCIWHWACKKRSWGKSWHSLNNFFCHTHNCLLHTHASHPASHPKAYISATVLDLLSVKSKRCLNLSHKRISHNHGSAQNNISDPSPTFRVKPSPNHPASTPPTPSQILTISLR